MERALVIASIIVGVVCLAYAVMSVSVLVQEARAQRGTFQVEGAALGLGFGV
jgi:hypothetical protein